MVSLYLCRDSSRRWVGRLNLGYTCISVGFAPLHLNHDDCCALRYVLFSPLENDLGIEVLRDGDPQFVHFLLVIENNSGRYFQLLQPELYGVTAPHRIVLRGSRTWGTRRILIPLHFELVKKIYLFS